VRTVYRVIEPGVWTYNRANLTLGEVTFRLQAKHEADGFAVLNTVSAEFKDRI
jgi:hypothetical protein